MLAMIEQYQQAWEELTAPGAQFATKVIEVRGVPIKVFESALPSPAEAADLLTSDIDANDKPLDSSTCTACSPATGLRWRCATIPSGSSGTGP